MLPATPQLLVVPFASAINDGPQRRHRGVKEERRILPDPLPARTGGKKLSFTARQRRRPATAGRPRKHARRGRSGKPKDVRKLASLLALEDRGWAYP
jgi:hypothetical protein